MSKSIKNTIPYPQAIAVGQVWQYIHTNNTGKFIWINIVISNITVNKHTYITFTRPYSNFKDGKIYITEVEATETLERFVNNYRYLGETT